MFLPPRPLPDAAPIDMPVQDFDVAPPSRDVPATAPQGLRQRRLFMVAGAALIGATCARAMATPFFADGIGPIDAGFFLLFFGLFAWIAFGFLNSMAGFFVLLGTGPGLPPSLARARLPERRTAVLLPIYNEDVDAVFARLATMTSSIDRLGLAPLFDFFVLSDSAPTAEPAEFRAWAALAERSVCPVYYRRRRENVARKPGNIADWVTRFGGAYEHMIVLDADSLMSGVAMARLAAVMEANPGVGLIQTIPEVREARTLFARWQQFASALYGPIASAGLTWWSGSEATFWGHNAIIRVRAFAESCGLPALRGREPFGGHIMSHDMVEAALLRRRGWAVHMLSLPDGSYEEFPPTAIDHAIRDRRWCQGNIQHLRLIGAKGFHWINRLQLLMGASAFLTSPLWLLLLVGTLAASHLTPDRVLTAPPSWLLAATIALLFGPKIAALVWVSTDDGLRRSLGGGHRVLKGVALDVPLSMLLAPVTMLTQTMSIVDIVLGRPSGWAAQRRDVESIRFVDAAIAFRWHIVLGAAFVAAMVVGLEGAFWTLPVAIGLLFAPWTVTYTGSAEIGARLAQRGIFAHGGEAESDEEVGPLWRRLLAGPQSRRMLQP